MGAFLGAVLSVYVVGRAAKASMIRAGSREDREMNVRGWWAKTWAALLAALLLV